jgi:hypothetical protein
VKEKNQIDFSAWREKKNNNTLPKAGHQASMEIEATRLLRQHTFLRQVAHLLR